MSPAASTLYVVHPPNPLDHLGDWLRRARRPGRAVRQTAIRRRSSSATSTPRTGTRRFAGSQAAGWRDAHQLAGRGFSCSWPSRQGVAAADPAPRPRPRRRLAGRRRRGRRRPARQRPPRVRRHASSISPTAAAELSSAFSTTSGSDGWIQYCFVATSWAGQAERHRLDQRLDHRRRLRTDDVGAEEQAGAPVGEHLDEAGRVLPRPPGGDPGVVVAGGHVVEPAARGLRLGQPDAWRSAGG